MMTDDRNASPNERERQFWNSPATRAWADEHAHIDRLFTGITAVALAAAAVKPGERVLDLGCGSGTTLLALAERVGPSGQVLGVDIAEASVRRAQERIAASGMSQAQALLADASTHAFEPGGFDLAFSRFGVMFFADPVASFANIHTAMKPGGRLALAVFRTAGENPWVTGPFAAVRHLLPPQPTPGPEDPGQFSWADPARVRRILAGAGFHDVALRPADPVIVHAGPGGAGEAAAFATRMGPLMRATMDAPDELRRTVRAGLQAFFQGQDGPEGIVMPAAIWMVSARA